MSPASLREAFQLISAADKVLSNVANIGKELLGDLNGPPEGKIAKPRSAPVTKGESGTGKGGDGDGGGTGAAGPRQGG